MVYLLMPIEPEDEVTEQPQTLAEKVGAEVGAQRQEVEMDAIDAAALAEPAFDKRSGTSNFGKRVSARIQQACR